MPYSRHCIIDTNDPGRADVVISVGALGNASGTPLDGSQNMSFGERTVDEGRVIDGNNDNKGMLVCSGSESSTSYNTLSGFDPSDPDVIADLMTRPPMAIPMGLCNSPDIFPEQMSELMDGLAFIQTYIDDLLCLTKGSFTDHLEKIELVLQRLQKAGLKVNVTKSFFARSQVEHLGYWITRTGIKPVYDKVKAVLKIAEPKN